MEVIKNGREGNDKGFTITVDFLEKNHIGGYGDFAEELYFECLAEGVMVEKGTGVPGGDSVRFVIGLGIVGRRVRGSRVEGWGRRR